MSAPQFTSGPWFGPNYNSSTAEPTRALTGKFKPKGHKSLSDYRLRVEVSGDNVAADSRLIAAAPELYEALDAPVEAVMDDDICEAFPIAKHAGQAALAKARGDQ